MVYLPPSGVRDGVAELVRVNPDLEKIVIVTEKISVHDAREIRAMGQANGVDIIGGNCLGVADSWNRVRIGGALGGDNPGETLLKGSVAIFSNSGSFTTTIAQYLATAGWGTTTLDLAAARTSTSTTPRATSPTPATTTTAARRRCSMPSPAATTSRASQSKKPIVACVVGRWKSKLTRAVGHAGAMAGSGDDAADEGTLVHGDVRRRRDLHARAPGLLGEGRGGHQHRPHPAALTAVMALNGVEPDFAPEGDLSLKAWLGNDQGLALPAELDLPMVEAPDALRRADRELRRQVGAVFVRQTMKDKSGASVMDPTTQVTSVHGVSMLDVALQPFEANLCLPSCTSATAPTTTRCSTSRSRPRSTWSATRSWSPPTRRARPATRRTRCWPRRPASWARAGSAGVRAARER